MIIPIRCFTCGKLIADKWLEYEEQLQEEYNKLTDGELVINDEKKNYRK